MYPFLLKFKSINNCFKLISLRIVLKINKRKGGDRMSTLLFLSIFFTVLIYYAFQIYVSKKIIELNLRLNNLRIDEVKDVDFLFRVSIFSMGVLFALFLMFFIPKNFSLYCSIGIHMLTCFIGLFVIYNVSCRTMKDMFNINILMVSINFVLAIIPILILLVANISI